MYLPFGVLFFANFGIAIGGFSSETKEPKLKNWVYFEQIIVKSTQFGQNWALFYWKRYTDMWVHVTGRKIGIEKSNFQVLAGTSMYDFGKGTPQHMPASRWWVRLWVSVRMFFIGHWETPVTLKCLSHPVMDVFVLLLCTLFTYRLLYNQWGFPIFLCTCFLYLQLSWMYLLTIICGTS